MCIKKLLEKVTKNIKWCDIPIIKLSVMLFTLFLITAWPAFTDLVFRVEWYWYLILSIVIVIPMMKRIFFK